MAAKTSPTQTPTNNNLLAHNMHWSAGPILNSFETQPKMTREDYLGSLKNQFDSAVTMMAVCAIPRQLTRALNSFAL
jgi:hypothetical protein